MPALRFMKRWLKSRWYKSLPPIFPPIISCCSPWCNAKRSFVQNRRHEHKFMYWMKLKIFTLQHYRITKHYIKLKNKKPARKRLIIIMYLWVSLSYLLLAIVQKSFQPNHVHKKRCNRKITAKRRSWFVFNKSLNKTIFAVPMPYLRSRK